MGIDMYLYWTGMTAAEREAQLAGFDTHAVDMGHVGYLREAYHGEPYATHALAPECWTEAQKYMEKEDGEHFSGVQIPAAVLRTRLPGVIAAAIERGREVYGEALEETSPAVKAFIDFVELAERKEAETGCACWVYSSY